MGTKTNFVDKAKFYIGFNYKHFCEEIWGQGQVYAWCAAFVLVVGKETGIDIPNTASCTQQMLQWKTRGKYHTDKNAQVGDVIYYSWTKNANDLDHVGICILSAPTYIIVCEGNYGNDSNALTKVSTRVVPRNYAYFMGYARPDFDAESEKPVIDSTYNPSTDTQKGAYPTIKWSYKVDNKIKELQQILKSKGYDIAIDGQAGDETYKAVRNFTIELNDRGSLTKWVQERLNAMGFNCGYADGFAEQPTMDGIAKFQKKYELGVGFLGGTDWYYILR